MVSDHDRRNLFTALQRQLGEGPAATLMELIPSTGRGDLVRQSDVAALRGDLAELHGEVAELRGGVAELRGEMRSQLPRLYTANVATALATAGLVLAAAKLA